MSEHKEDDLKTSRGGITGQQVVEQWELSYHLGTALMQLYRASRGRAGGRADALTKAIYHLNRELTKLTSNGGS